MLTPTMAQTIIADMFFNGSMIVAGLVMYVGVLAIFFTVSRNLITVLILSLPITLIFASMGILSGDLLIVLILVTVIGLGLAARGVITGRD